MRLAAIYIAPEAGAAMRFVPSALLLPTGLEGDRYATHTGSFSRFPDPAARPLSLFATEDLESLYAEGFDLTSGLHRRNLVLTGLDFPSLLNKSLRIGPTAAIRITRTCSTCQHLERLTHLPGLANALKSRAGLRAMVLTPGPVHAGDSIMILE